MMKPLSSCPRIDVRFVCPVSEFSFTNTGERERPYSKRMSYKRIKADKSVCHDSDFSRLPKDSVVVKTFYKYSSERISYILEHKY